MPFKSRKPNPMSNLLMDWFFHLDSHLAALAASHGAAVYAILFAVIFIETGVVVMPFLPGDSLPSSSASCSFPSCLA